MGEEFVVKYVVGYVGWEESKFFKVFVVVFVYMWFMENLVFVIFKEVYNECCKGNCLEGFGFRYEFI